MAGVAGCVSRFQLVQFELWRMQAESSVCSLFLQSQLVRCCPTTCLPLLSLSSPFIAAIPQCHMMPAALFGLILLTFWYSFVRLVFWHSYVCLEVCRHSCGDYVTLLGHYPGGRDMQSLFAYTISVLLFCFFFLEMHWLKPLCVTASVSPSPSKVSHIHGTPTTSKFLLHILKATGGQEVC